MIVVVGSANMDLLAEVEHLPAPGETVPATGFLRAPGGKGANQSVAAARAGSEVQFVGRIGADADGAELLRNLEAARVGTRYLLTDREEPSGQALIAVDRHGENSIVVVRGANGHVSPDDVQAAGEALRTCRVLLLQLEIPMAAVERAARLAHDAGALVVLNPAPAAPLPAGLLRSVDVVVPNSEEMESLAGGRAESLLAQGPQAVVITRGSQGADVVTAEGVHRVPAFPATPVDTVGAGDAFVGNLAHALDEGRTLLEAARFASAAAALSVQKRGAQPSMPSGAETTAMLERA